MFVMLLFKPEAIQGLGLLGPNALISLVLASLLFVSVLTGGPTDFLRSNQIRCYVLLGALFAVNWVLVGRVQAPSSLADLDHTARSLYRYVVHLSLLVFIIAFVRTRRQLLVLTGLFIAAILVTIPGALSVSPDIETKMTALRAAAVGAVRSAENANRLAFMCVMGISVVWFAMQHYRSRLFRAGGALLILVLILTVFRSGSRSGVLNLILLVGLILLQSRVNPGNFGLLVIVALVGIDRAGALRRRAAGRLRRVPERARARRRLAAHRVRLRAGGRAVQVRRPGRRGPARHPRRRPGPRRPAPHPGGGHRQLPVDHLRPERHRHRRSQRVRPGRGRGRAAHARRLPVAVRADGARSQPGAPPVEREPQVGLRWLVLATRTNLILLLVVSLFAEAWKEFYILLITGTAGRPGRDLWPRSAAESGEARVTPTPVAYVMPRMWVGGAPHHLMQVLERLDRRRFEPVLCCLTTDRTRSAPLLDRVRALGVPILDAGLRDAPNALVRPHTVLQMARIARELRRRRVRIVHSYLFHANWFGTLTARLARIPVAIVSKRSIDVYPRARDRWACRFADRLSDCVIAVAQAVRDHVHATDGCPLERSWSSPTGSAGRPPGRGEPDRGVPGRGR